mmetsp:Transcript_45205/g.96562  ORF Transcript_45205/g.96562 Transcript_45205/m.96562 type:complete len:240 (-) Transcript_45205:195-914(-)
MPLERRRGSGLIRAVLASVLIIAAWDLMSPSAFVGMPAASERTSATQMKGYRLDWMLLKKDGTSLLQTQDGYFVGEKGFEKSQGAQGLRYRMRPSLQEYKDGTEIPDVLQIGPVKIRIGEAFGGSGNNKALRDLKRKIVSDGVSDPAKLEENKYWEKRYGHKRWTAPYQDQSTGLAKGFLRGLSAWSGFDPLTEERGKTWIEADYGKPWLAKYVGVREKGWVTADQVKKEYDTGRLLSK